MGNCGSSEESKIHKGIESELKAHGKNFRNSHRLLLLGPGESGKSTLFKHARALYKGGFPEQERLAFTTVVYGNIVEGIKILLVESENREQSMTEENTKLARTILQLPLDAEITPNLAAKIKSVWEDKVVQETFSLRSQFQLGDGVPYFMGNLDRIGANDYKPSDDDIVRARVRTSGIKEEDILIDEIKFTVIDVGGQRGERRKWIHVFDNVTIVIFVAAISEYDQVLMEDDTKNRLLEALDLFEMICQQEAFRKTNFLVMLNKYDLFEKKFEQQMGNMHDVFSDYDAGWDKDKAVQFIINKFLSKVPDQDKEIYFQPTSATQPENVKTVLTVAREAVLTDNLFQSNLL